MSSLSSPRASTGRSSDGRYAYAVITPVRDEATHLRRLAESMRSQTLQPAAWLIVDSGSSDDTVRVGLDLSAELSWAHIHEAKVGGAVMRGGPIVRAFHLGLRHLPAVCDVVVKVDADTSFEPFYLDRLIGEFERDPTLGIAGGSCYEQQVDGAWRRRHGTGSGVWGASRAYRRACLDEILPLEERMGWDTIDLVAAEVRGWTTGVVGDLPFRHHRREGERDPSRFFSYLKQGQAAHYMGYRLPYLALRTAYRASRDVAAIGIACGYVAATLRREPQCADGAIRASIRDQQRLSRLHLRAREALQPRTKLGEPPHPSGAVDGIVSQSAD